MMNDLSKRRVWTGLDILKLLDERGERGVILGGVTDEHDLQALRQMYKRGWIELNEFGVPSARITEAGRASIAKAERQP